MAETILERGESRPPWAVVALALSLAAHAVAIAVAVATLDAPRAEVVLPVEAPSGEGARGLPEVSVEGLATDEHAPTGVSEAPDRAGGAPVAHPDVDRGGSGGDPRGAHALNLASDVDGFVADPDLRSDRSRRQHQRLRTAARRASWEDRRSSREPMELVFLAEGSGQREERRRDAPRDPSRGARAAAGGEVRGGAPGLAALDRGGEGPTAPAPALGAREARVGAGVRDGDRETDSRESAHVARGRPSVAEASPSVTARDRGRPSDTVDSDQAVASAVQALVHASLVGGAGGAGVGGSRAEEAGRAAAAGSNARGLSRSGPLGDGLGDVLDLDSHDPRLLPYFRKLHARIDPLWRDAFPKQAMAELRQGYVILEMVVEPDGRATVRWPPVRPSGVDEFDRNCAEAIRRAQPFDPVPPELGRRPLRIRAPFAARNPVIR